MFQMNVVHVCHDRKVVLLDNDMICYAVREMLVIASAIAIRITDNSVSFYQRNLQLLVTEVYQTNMNLNPSFMKEAFKEKYIKTYK